MVARLYIRFILRNTFKPQAITDAPFGLSIGLFVVWGLVAGLWLALVNPTISSLWPSGSGSIKVKAPEITLGGHWPNLIQMQQMLIL